MPSPAGQTEASSLTQKIPVPMTDSPSNFRNDRQCNSAKIEIKQVLELNTFSYDEIKRDI